MADGSYSAGSLYLGIDAEATNTINILDALIGRLNIINGGLGKMSKGSKIANSKGNLGLLNVAKWTAVLYSAKRLGRYVADIVQAGSDYTETLNLWQVAMRSNLDMADEFVNKITKAYGISSKTVMNAQATFKNMIGSLGQIDQATAYKLSEALVQMSADFSSLYNVQLESAFNKMQAMLAGQVRPIRSAGLDMTETTLYQYYQAIGGSKSMRQLNRTEKQLLSILAVFKQMGSAGALGDMTKTLNQFANQARMMTEYWQELKSWTGLILKDFLDQHQVLIYINAALITATEIIKAIARSKGLGGESFIDGLFETTEATNDEIDELQGKLLDFDKFRSLQGEEQGAIGIDERLLEALSGYSSKIDEAKNKAKDIADNWLSTLGFTKTTNGQFEITDEALQSILDKAIEISSVFGGISAFMLSNKLVGNTWLSVIVGLFVYAYSSSEKLRESTNKLVGALSSGFVPVIDIIVDVLPVILNAITPIIEFFAETIIMLDELGVLEPLIWGIVNGFIAFKGLQLISYIKKLYDNMGAWVTLLKDAPNAINKMLPLLQNTELSFSTVAIAIGVAAASYMIFTSYFNSLDGEAKKVSAWGTIIVATLTAVTAAYMAYQGAISAGTAIAFITASVAAGIAAINALIPEVPNYEKGASDIDSGTVFRAGEFGKVETVYTGSNGKTNVANVKQMEQAFYNALARHSAEGNDPVTVIAYLDGEKVYENTTSRAKARGNVWAKA